MKKVERFLYFWIFVLGVCTGLSCSTKESAGAGPSSCYRQLELCQMNLAVCRELP